MIKLAEIYSSIQNEIKELKSTNTKRFTLQISANDYKSLFLLFAEKHLLLNYKSNEKYIIDNLNRDLINDIYYYLTASDKGTLDPDKGLIIVGGFGTGKTTILMIIKDIIEALTLKRVTFMSSLSLPEHIKNNGLEFYYKRPMIVDEIGREVKVIKDFGTEKHPLIELLTQRYNNKALTFGTSNYSYEDLSEMYGTYIAERLREMCNIKELKGQSKRK